MPFVEVLFLQPSEHFMPRSRLDTPSHPLIVPNLRIFYMSSPTAFIANALDTLVIANCAPDQFVGSLTHLHSLSPLEICQMRSDKPVDWTALLSEGTWPVLTELRIICRSYQSYALPCRAAGVSTPCLRDLYTTAAVLVDAPVAQDVHVVHARYVDYLRMLRWTPSVARTTLRASTNVRLPMMSSSAWPGAATVRLDALESLKVYGDIQDYVTGFFGAIAAPNADIHFDCDMTSPPNPQAIVDVDALLRATLNEADTDSSQM